MARGMVCGSGPSLPLSYVYEWSELIATLKSRWVESQLFSFRWYVLYKVWSTDFALVVVPRTSCGTVGYSKLFCKFKIIFFFRRDLKMIKKCDYNFELKKTFQMIFCLYMNMPQGGFYISLWYYSLSILKLIKITSSTCKVRLTPSFDGSTRVDVSLLYCCQFCFPTLSWPTVHDLT